MLFRFFWKCLAKWKCCSTCGSWQAPPAAKLERIFVAFQTIKVVSRKSWRQPLLDSRQSEGGAREKVRERASLSTSIPIAKLSHPTAVGSSLLLSLLCSCCCCCCCYCWCCYCCCFIFHCQKSKATWNFHKNFFPLCLLSCVGRKAELLRIRNISICVRLTYACVCAGCCCNFDDLRQVFWQCHAPWHSNCKVSFYNYLTREIPLKCRGKFVNRLMKCG